MHHNVVRDVSKTYLISEGREMKTRGDETLVTRPKGETGGEPWWAAILQRAIVSPSQQKTLKTLP
jgi:hypothetical protein